ncbi:hypothetical protein niasHS_010646 [Heterodera schachtii]|uniref:Uncharacterized protein n=1 Tax=Heterodera schachtii TaxID=97005 RepID=A0ABD2IS56_HETSC
MLRSFVFLCRTFPSLSFGAQFNKNLFVASQKNAALTKHLHVSPFRYADSSDDGKEKEENIIKIDETIQKEEKDKVDETLQKEEKAAQLTSLEPQRLRMKPDHRRVLVRMAIKAHKINAASEEGGGMSGAKSLLSMNTTEIDRHLPTAMTLLQPFDGVPFRELPVVHIKASSNNTIIHAFNFITKRPIVYTSCRKEGFKNTKKKSPLAGQTTGAAAGHWAGTDQFGEGIGVGWCKCRFDFGCDANPRIGASA